MPPTRRHGLRGYVFVMNNRDCWAYKILDDDGSYVERRQAPTRHEAANRMEAAIDRIHAARVAAAAPTVGEAVESHLAWRRSGAQRSYEARTLANDRAHAALLPDWLLDTPLPNVTVADGRRLLQQLATARRDRAGRRLPRGYSNRTRAKVIQLLRAAVKQAGGPHSLDHPQLRVTVPVKTGNPLSDREAHALWAAARRWSRGGDGERIRDAAHAALMLWAGLRIGEASGVGSEHVNGDRREVEVAQHVVYVSPSEADGGPHGLFLVPGGKTQNSERTVPVAEPARPVLQRWIDERPNVREDAPAWDGRTLLCTTGTGGLLAPWTARSAVQRMASEAGLAQVTPHRLRDTFATMLVRQGVPTRVVAEVLGQKDTTMADRYAAVSSATVVDAVARLGTTPRWI